MKKIGSYDEWLLENATTEAAEVVNEAYGWNNFDAATFGKVDNKAYDVLKEKVEAHAGIAKIREEAYDRFVSRWQSECSPILGQVFKGADAEMSMDKDASWDRLIVQVNGIPKSGWNNGAILLTDVSTGSSYMLFTKPTENVSAAVTKDVAAAMQKAKIKIPAQEFAIGDPDLKTIPAMQTAATVFANPATMNGIFHDYFTKKYQILGEEFAAYWEISDPYKYSQDVMAALKAYLMSEFTKALDKPMTLVGQDGNRNKATIFDKGGRHGEFHGNIETIKVVKRTPKFVDLDYTYTMYDSDAKLVTKSSTEPKRVAVEALYSTWLSWTEDGKATIADPIVQSATK